MFSKQNEAFLLHNFVLILDHTIPITNPSRDNENQFQDLKALGLLEIDPNKFLSTGDATFSFEDECVGQFYTFQDDTPNGTKETKEDYDSLSNLMQFPIQSGTNFENVGLTNEIGTYFRPFTIFICTQNCTFIHFVCSSYP